MSMGMSRWLVRVRMELACLCFFPFRLLSVWSDRQSGFSNTSIHLCTSIIATKLALVRRKHEISALSPPRLADDNGAI